MGLFEQLFYILLAITVVLGLIIAYLGFCIYDLHKQLKLISSTKILYSKWNILIVIANILLKGVNSEIPVDQIPIKSVRTSVIKAIGKQVIIKALATAGVLLVAAVISGALSFVAYQYQQQLNAAITAISTLFDDEICQCYAKCSNDSKDDEKTAYELVYGTDEYNKLVGKMNCTEAELDGFTPYTKIEDSDNDGGLGGGSGSDPNSGDGSSGGGSGDLKGLRVAFDIDGTLDTSKGSHNKETLRDGAVEAIQSLENAGVDYAVITAASDTNRKKEWLNTEIFSKLNSKSHYQGFYSVDAGEKRATWLKNNNYNVLVDDRSNSRKKAESKGINTLDPTKIDLKNITKELEKFVDTNKVAYVQTNEIPILARTDAKKAIDYIRTAKSKGETVKAENVDYSTVDPTGEIQYRWIDCLNGQQKNYFITQHINSDILEAYKAVIMDNDLGIHDNIDRKHLSEEQLRDDLKKFLADYKKNGRNPVCPTCKNLGSATLGHKCKGAEHWYKRREFQGVPVENRLISGNKTPSWNQPDKPIKRNKLGHATGDHTVEIDGLTYYWYHQSTEVCKYNVDNFASVKISGGASDIAQNRACSIYSTAIALSNVLGYEITPKIVVENILGVTINNNDANLANNGNGIRSNAGSNNNQMQMNKTRIAARTVELYGSEGLKAYTIAITQDNVDKALDDGGVVVFSIATIPGWRNSTTGSHFITIMKKSGNFYYHLNSSDSDRSGFPKMKLSKTWDQIAAGIAGDRLGVVYIGPEIDDDGPLPEGLKQDAMNFYDVYSDSTGNVVDTLSTGVDIYDGLPPWSGSCYKLNTGKCNKYVEEYVGVASKGFTTAKDDNNTKLVVKESINAAGISAFPILAFCNIDDYGQSINWEYTTASTIKGAAILSKGGKTYYMPCTSGGDNKGHTWPGGVSQTCLSNKGSYSGDGTNHTWTFNTDGGNLEGELINKPVTLSDIKTKYPTGGVIQHWRGGSGPFTQPQFNLETHSDNLSSLNTKGYALIGFLSWK